MDIGNKCVQIIQVSKRLYTARRLVDELHAIIFHDTDNYCYKVIVYYDDNGVLKNLCLLMESLKLAVEEIEKIKLF